MIPTAYPLIFVEWLDSCSSPNLWEFIEELEPLPSRQIISVGFLIEETEEYITIASSISKTQVLGRLTIPKRSMEKQGKIT